MRREVLQNVILLSANYVEFLAASISSCNYPQASAYTPILLPNYDPLCSNDAFYYHNFMNSDNNTVQLLLDRRRRNYFLDG